MILLCFNLEYKYIYKVNKKRLRDIKCNCNFFGFYGNKLNNLVKRYNYWL